MIARNKLETVAFNARFMESDLVLLQALIRQEIVRREVPSERLLNAEEITERLLNYQKEMLA